jgi:hypothetical protein
MTTVHPHNTITHFFWRRNDRLIDWKIESSRPIVVALIAVIRA